MFPEPRGFFTVNLAEHKANRLLIDKIDLLRNAFEYTKQRHPFRMDAVVILPDHLHCIWTTATIGCRFFNSMEYAERLFFSSHRKGEKIFTSRKCRRERGMWQRRF